MDRASLQFLDNLKNNRLGSALSSSGGTEGPVMTIVKVNNAAELVAVKYLYSTGCQVTICLVSLLSCAFYVLTTYDIPDNEIVFATLELLFFAAFLMDYLFHIIASKGYRIKYLVSFSGIVDFLSLLPVLSLLQVGQADILLIPKSFLGFLRFLRLLTFLQFLHLKNLSQSNYSQQPFDTHLAIKVNELVYEVSRLVIYIATFLFLSTSVIFTYSEYVPYSFAGNALIQGTAAITYRPLERLQWFDAFYFVVVTVSTVGYGDVVPLDPVARLLAIVIIIIGFSIIPTQVSKVISTLLGRSFYLGEYEGSNHVILCGIIDFELVDRFLTEFFHETHNPPAFKKRDITVVILAPNQPSLQLKTLLEYSIFKNRVRYYIGSSKSQNDLGRVRMQDCIAVYVVPDIRTSSLRSEEDSLFLSSVVITKYLHARGRKQLPAGHTPASDFYGTTKPLVLVKLTSSARNKRVLTSQGVDVVLALQEFKYSLLAYGAAFPGFLALFSNLNRAQSYSQRKLSQWHLSAEGGQSHWQPKYYHSTRYSVQQIAVTEKIVISHNRILFKNAALMIWRRSLGKVFLVGVKSKVSKKVFANPNFLEILECESIFVIASSWTDGLRALYDDSATGGDDCAVGEQPADSAAPCERSSSAAKISLSAEPQAGRQQEVRYRHLNPLLAIVRGAGTVNGSCEVYGNMANHTVIIYQSTPDLTDQSLILPVIHFCNAFRSVSNDHIIVLCDRARELYALAQEVHCATSRGRSDRRSIFYNVHFFAGMPRSADNLLACGIKKARSVCLLRPPVASEVSEASIESLNYLRENVVNTDKNTIITMLNIQNLLSNQWTWPFISIELVHEVNINFIGNSSATNSKESSKSRLLREQQWARMHTESMFDWELISSGSCFPHTIIDAFIVQAIFNPDILRLWEALLNIGGPHRSARGQPGSSSASEEKTADRGNHVIDEGFDGEEDDKPTFINLSSKVSPTRADSESLDSSSERGRPQRSFSAGSIFSDAIEDDEGVAGDDNGDDNGDGSAEDSPLGGKIDKFGIPVDFVGRRFKNLYEFNLSVHAVLTIALYRFPKASSNQGGSGDGDDSSDDGGSSPLEHATSQLPFVLVCPDGDELIQPLDEVFVIT